MTAVVVVAAVVVVEAVVVEESLEVGPMVFVLDLSRHLKFHVCARITVEGFVRAVIMLLEVALRLYLPVLRLESPVTVSIFDHAPDHEITEVVVVSAVSVEPAVDVMLVVLVLVEVVTTKVPLHLHCSGCCQESRVTVSIPGHSPDH